MAATDFHNGLRAGARGAAETSPGVHAAARAHDASWVDDGHRDQGGGVASEKLARKLATWADHLLKGIDVAGQATDVPPGGAGIDMATQAVLQAGASRGKRVEQIMIAPWTAQNLFIVAERPAVCNFADRPASAAG